MTIRRFLHSQIGNGAHDRRSDSVATWFPKPPDLEDLELAISMEPFLILALTDSDETWRTGRREKGQQLALWVGVEAR
jgi:hypothetical protein